MGISTLNKILIVENDAMIRFKIHASLKANGYRILSAAAKNTALEIINELNAESLQEFIILKSNIESEEWTFFFK